jgi:hypothetical protein
MQNQFPRRLELGRSEYWQVLEMIEGPGGAIYDLWRVFLDIAGPPIADTRLY